VSTQQYNAEGQPIGPALPNWQPPPRPRRAALTGHFCRLEPLTPDEHADALYEANALDTAGQNWTYLPYGPFATPAAYRRWMETTCLGDDPLFYAILDGRSGRAVGLASYLRIDGANGVIEVGHLNYSPLLQRTPAATEAMYLMMEHAFRLGYRRYEWKCDALNAPSRAAAQRLGFSYEGTFRQAVIYKGRSRDTAWYSIVDSEWPALQAALTRWLNPENFDAEGRQRVRLAEWTEPRLARKG